MLHTISGRIVSKNTDSIIIEVGGLGLFAYTNTQTLSSLPDEGGEAKIFCHLFVREEKFELYGFHNEEELRFFEILNSVAGVGPKTALGVLNMDRVPNIMAAILEKRVDVLTRASGIGKKTAERIILELQSKIKLPTNHASSKEMDLNNDVEDILVGLGYTRGDVRAVLQTIVEKETIEERLRHALRELGSTK
ncbi:MAG: Holliday junction branch migration protein RuvA [Candidatus Jorgensenbacteria bacterium]|nr:Holliday junction branch migration protein RuvA [Candidatus Jorgensenbacteria bacterium]